LKAASTKVRSSIPRLGILIRFWSNLSLRPLQHFLIRLHLQRLVVMLNAVEIHQNCLDHLLINYFLKLCFKKLYFIRFSISRDKRFEIHLKFSREQFRVEYISAPQKTCLVKAFFSSAISFKKIFQAVLNVGSISIFLVSWMPCSAEIVPAELHRPRDESAAETFSALGRSISVFFGKIFRVRR